MGHIANSSETKKDFSSIGQCGGSKGKTAPGKPPVPAPPVPPPPPPVAVLVIQVVDSITGKPVSGITIVASEFQFILDEKVTDAAGLADFGRVTKGSLFGVLVKLSDSDREKFELKSTGFTVPAQIPGSPPFKIEIKSLFLNIVSVDPVFAPGIENLDIKYNIQGLEDKKVLLEISSDKYPGDKKIMVGELLTDQKVTGNGKLISPNVKGNLSGPLQNQLLSPQFSPYKVTLKVSDSNVLKDEKETKVEIHHLDIEVNAPNNKLIMNDPEEKALVTSKLFIKKKNGQPALTPIGFEIFYTLTVGASNTTPLKSFIYSTPKTLGKKDDPNAVYWEKHPDNEGFSTDGFKLNCSAKKLTFSNNAEFGIVKTFFKPSGVSGDKFNIKSDYFAFNAKTSLAKKEINELAVWRQIDVEPFEMKDLTHVSTNGTDAIMLNFYPESMFVKYKLGTVHTLPIQFKVQYIGLWDHATQTQRNWVTHQAKTGAEIPPPPEIAAANGPAGPAQNAARASIKTRADAWVARLHTGLFASWRAWIADARIPVKAIVGIQFTHPKEDQLPAGNSDAITHEWSDFPWLRITSPRGRRGLIHPDTSWAIVQGSTFDERVFIFSGTPPPRIQVAIAHESGHLSRSQFKRTLFGDATRLPGDPLFDHSDPKDGLMESTAKLNRFTAREQEILKGLR